MTKKRNKGDEIITALKDSIKHMISLKTRAQVHKVKIPDDMIDIHNKSQTRGRRPQRN